MTNRYIWTVSIRHPETRVTTSFVFEDPAIMVATILKAYDGWRVLPVLEVDKEHYKSWRAADNNTIDAYRSMIEDEVPDMGAV